MRLSLKVIPAAKRNEFKEEGGTVKVYLIDLLITNGNDKSPNIVDT